LEPEPLLTPEGSVAAFAHVVDALEPGARVLVRIGLLAVALRSRGFDVVASDLSGAMVNRTRKPCRRPRRRRADGGLWL
jgi:hypothetical protein